MVYGGFDGGSCGEFVPSLISDGGFPKLSA